MTTNPVLRRLDGVDLYLWVRVVLTLAVLAAAAGAALVLV